MKLIGNRQKTLLHVAKAKLGLDELVYRDILRIHGGVESSKNLTWSGYQMVMGHLVSLGFAKKVASRSHASRDDHRPGFATAKQKAMIAGLWADLSYAPKERQAGALREFMHRIAGVSDLRFLSSEGAGKVINALLGMKGQADRLKAEG